MHGESLAVKKEGIGRERKERATNVFVFHYTTSHLKYPDVVLSQATTKTWYFIFRTMQD